MDEISRRVDTTIAKTAGSLPNSICCWGRLSLFQVGSEILVDPAGQQFSLTNGLSKVKQFRVSNG